MTELLLNSGLRRSEICALKVDDINVERSSLIVTGKGKKRIEQPIKASLIVALLEYINTERKTIMEKYVASGGTDVGYLFVSFVGEKLSGNESRLNKGNKVSPTSFCQQIKTYSKLAGLKNADMISPHALRRRYVTSVYEQTGDILIAQKAARHSSSATTVQCYIDFDQNRLREAINGLYKESKNE